MSQPQNTAAPVVSVRSLGKCYLRGREKLVALNDISFQIRSGEFVSIVGPSGSGKTTLLNLLGCMDSPSTGFIEIQGQDVGAMTEMERTRLRRDRLGFVFQHFGLVPTLTVAENVALPALFARRVAGHRVDGLLERVGLADRRDHRPHQLSGGEMQRVAIARALINEPLMLLADEPTGNLDSDTGTRILELFRELNRSGLTVVVVTHNPILAQVADRCLTLRDGRLVGSDPIALEKTGSG